MRTLQRRLVRVAAAAVAVVGWGAVIVAPTGASAAIVTTPVGLSPGDQYRLAFVTTTLRDATSSNIADYNDFVTLAANSEPDLADLGATWTAIASTETIDARDNTGTNPFFTGEPIYLLDGTKIADNYADLWDGTINQPLDIFQTGATAPFVPIFTGTGTNGVASLGNELGIFCCFNKVMVGTTQFPFAKWILDEPVFGIETNKRFYAISSQLTVAAVPLPGALILFGSGLACLAVLRRRNRSVRPA